MPGHETAPRQNNGPALARHGAEAARDAVAKPIQEPPKQMRKSQTWDQWPETAQHKKLKSDTGIGINFCHTQSACQRTSNENTNGRLRHYFPNGADLSRHRPNEVDALAFPPNSLIPWF